MQQKVTWTNSARIQLRDAISFIRKDSLVNSIRVRKRIINKSLTLNKHPKKYPADKYKINNDGNFRAFIMYH